MRKSDRMRIVFLPRCCGFEQNVIRFSLRVPDSSQTYRRGRAEGAESQRRGSAVPLRFQVTSVLRDLSRGRQRATRASVPSNVLENSLTPRSVALHLPIVASRARPRTETPLREGAENLGGLDSQNNISKKHAANCKILNRITRKRQPITG